MDDIPSDIPLPARGDPGDRDVAGAREEGRAPRSPEPPRQGRPGPGPSPVTGAAPDPGRRAGADPGGRAAPDPGRGAGADRDRRAAHDTAGPRLVFELYSSTFCGACLHTRGALSRAVALVPGAMLREYDVALDPDRARDSGITATPSVIVRDSGGTEVQRASGVPTLDQVLVAAARALRPEAS